MNLTDKRLLWSLALRERSVWGRAVKFGFTAGLPFLYVTGGARGASPLNQRVAALLPRLLETCQVLHQTGPATANVDRGDDSLGAISLGRR